MRENVVYSFHKKGLNLIILKLRDLSLISTMGAHNYYDEIG